jgi:hypothetical protein
LRWPVPHWESSSLLSVVHWWLCFSLILPHSLDVLVDDNHVTHLFETVQFSCHYVMSCVLLNLLSMTNMYESQCLTEFALSRQKSVDDHFDCCVSLALKPLGWLQELISDCFCCHRRLESSNHNQLTDFASWVRWPKARSVLLFQAVCPVLRFA